MVELLAGAGESEDGLVAEEMSVVLVWADPVAFWLAVAGCRAVVADDHEEELVGEAREIVVVAWGWGWGIGVGFHGWGDAGW